MRETKARNRNKKRRRKSFNKIRPQTINSMEFWHMDIEKIHRQSVWQVKFVANFEWIMRLPVIGPVCTVYCTRCRCLSYLMCICTILEHTAKVRQISIKIPDRMVQTGRASGRAGERKSWRLLPQNTTTTKRMFYSW